MDEDPKPMMEHEVKEEFKRCKVVVEEVEIDGVMYFAIQDD
jgi:hypothetical protein